MAIFRQVAKGEGSEEGVAVVGGFGRQTERLHSLKSARKVKLLLYAESEGCSCADFLHIDFLELDFLKLDFLGLDFLEPDALQAGAFERAETLKILA
jgi:hypothetical protein